MRPPKFLCANFPPEEFSLLHCHLDRSVLFLKGRDAEWRDLAFLMDPTLATLP